MNQGSGGLHGSTDVELVEAGDPATWWSAYREALVGGVGATSLTVIDADSDYIVNKCVLADLEGADAESIGSDLPSALSRERRGAVMGAVQSGKTASMMAVIAKAVDAGVDGVVVLAGTRTNLWLQTWERVQRQLDTLPGKVTKRILLPGGSPQDVADGGSSVGSLYVLTDQLAARAVAKKRPIIAVVMKQVAHLERIAETLHEVVYPQIPSGGSFHLLVLDDEADDSSIAESDLTDASTLQERQVPRRIVDLWESRQLAGQTAIPELRATYVAYTATPQANFLQDQSNPLAPKDFVVCLRTPGADGDVDKLEPSYRVPDGLRGWYTGGDVYYKTLASVPLCGPVDEITEDNRLVHGLRGYLVASAVRLARAEGCLGPVRVQGELFESEAAAKRAGGPVMSMLVHPSAAKDEHFETAEQVLAWSWGRPGEGAVLRSNGVRKLGLEGIAADMDAQPDRWYQWLLDYRDANAHVGDLDVPPGTTPGFPDIKWDEVRRIILEEIAPATTVAVINSDDRADDRPVFEPVRAGDKWQAATNLSTVFVSGNVMSRGLTLEGLTTTLFTRTSDDPASDTQMQMQRWFGYRGSYIDVCRVLASTTQINLFSQYHETDVALRTQILNAMSADEPASPSVLQGRAFKATGKIKNLSGYPLWPGPDAFMATLNEPDSDLGNQELIANLFAEDAVGVPDASASQGRLLTRTLSLRETAELLDGFSYPAGTDGGVDPSAAARWSAVERVAGLGADDPDYPLFRMPEDTDPAAWGPASPFSVAAYLRMWALCLDGNVPAAFTTDEPPLLWSLVDLDARYAEQPRFRIGIRFGSGPLITEGPLASMGVTPMQRTIDGARVKGGWGSRNYRDGVLWGDEFFDRYISGNLPDLTPSRARARGEEGLLLLHVFQRDGGVSVSPALSIPVGGPDQVHAHVRRSDG